MPISPPAHAGTPRRPVSGAEGAGASLSRRSSRERGTCGAEYDVALDGVCARCAFELAPDGSEAVTVLKLTVG